MHEAVLERLRKEGLSHRNDVTGCEIWSGDFNRQRQPQFNGLNARDYMYQAASGEVVTRGEHVNMTCENDACISPAHMRKEAQVRRAKEPLSEEDIAIVEDKYFQRGFRIDVISEDHGWSKPYTTKLVAEARSRRGDTRETK